ncbi:glycosyltransferase family 4 protein [Paracoccus pacificus]|uniref:Glycosyltransferase family 4 protein n=1 Tax=Paracoccus pacificus TaxID=1463598 RepID=A0ABW4R2W9_9RHOB
MAARASPWLLDISRLVSRIGTGPLTGIDRIEAAWLRHLAEARTRDAEVLFLLCRSDTGQLLLPGELAGRVLDWAGGDRRGLAQRPGWRDRLRGPVAERHRALAALRPHAIGISLLSGGPFHWLARKIRRALPQGGTYLNLGHANLDPRLAATLAQVPGLRRVVMIHDTIPLDHPQYARRNQPAAHRRRLGTAMGSDLILTVSQDSGARIRHWAERFGMPATAPVVVTPPGIAVDASAVPQLPDGIPTDRPFFVTLGTIEPRKNHALLLDVWEELARRLPAGQIPRLLILGRRGWMNETVFARLDALPDGSPVMELPGLPDTAVTAILARAHGLLMPSHAEGFGLPLAEAAALGTPVLASPLPVVREVLGDTAVILPPDEPAAWAKAIAGLSIGPRRAMPVPELPGWPAHFARARQAIGGLAPAKTFD